MKLKSYMLSDILEHLSVQIQKKNVRKNTIVSVLPDKQTVVKEDCCQPRLVIVGQTFYGKEKASRLPLEDFQPDSLLLFDVIE